MVRRNKDKVPQVAVIGCGYWGKNLVRNYHNLGALKLICDHCCPIKILKNVVTF
jgi:hypothetical protein